MIKNRRHIALAITTALLVGATAMPASAKPGKWKGHPHKFEKNYKTQKGFIAPNQIYRMPSRTLPLWAQNSISASEAKSIARRHVRGGEVVDISRNGNTYRVRVIARDGRVVDVFIDANTGRVKR